MSELHRWRVLLAFDKFKGTLSADEAAENVAQAISTSPYGKQSQCRTLSLSDGGEGFVEALKEPYNLQVLTLDVTGPLGTQTTASYGVQRAEEGAKRKRVGVVEMAQAAGLELLQKDQRNPMRTSTYGVGEVLRHIINHHRCTDVILGVGGSATNDGGAGALQALGCVFKTADGVVEESHKLCGADLQRIESIEIPSDVLQKDVRITIACDVDNPFVGPHGAVHTFSAQKGASQQQQMVLEEGMLHYAAVLERCCGRDIALLSGAGAAGGIAGGFVAALGASLRSGMEIVAEAHHLEDAIRQSDVVFTGEGSYDAQTEHGKVVCVVRRVAASLNVPVYVLCGRTEGLSEAQKKDVFDLTSRFGKEKSLSDSAKCIKKMASDILPSLSPFCKAMEASEYT